PAGQVASAAWPSMPEVAVAGEHHGQAAFVGGGDDFVVAHAATRLDDAGCAGVGHNVETVTEGEEGVGSHGSALHRQAGVLGLDGGDAGRVDTAHLAGAHADGHVVGNEDDGVGFDGRGDFPGEQQV